MIPTRWASAWIVALALLPGPALGQSLSNDAFDIRYDGQGIRSLRRANDIHDTDYITRGGALGNIFIQYRTGAGPWKTAREVATIPATASGGNTVTYMVGVLLPTLPELSTSSAAVGGDALSSLSDGRFPPVADPGAPARPARPAAARPGATVPPPPAAFTWEGRRGGVQWVQYTFPSAQEVSSAQVYWASEETAPPEDQAPQVRVPASWRLLYQDGSRWTEVKASTPYGVEPSVFNRVDFAPVVTAALRLEVRPAEDSGAGVYEWRVGPERIVGPAEEIRAEQSFKLDGEHLDWTLTVTNLTSQPLEIGDLALPMNMAEGTPAARGRIYTQKLIRHSFIAGNGSWIYWHRANAAGPYLVMVPQGETGIEYAGRPAPASDSGDDPSGAVSPGGVRGAFTPFIHAAVSSVPPIAAGRKAGREQPWRLPITSLTLAPSGAGGDSVTYSFRFTWAKDFAGVRDALYDEGSIDVNIVPGMTIPIDLPALVALRTRQKIDRIVPEFPGETKVEVVGDRAGGNTVYKVSFSRLGENMLTVQYGGGKWSTLEFFVTEPLETLIRKRAAFLVNTMQHKDPAQWWYGVYSDWDQVNKVLRSPIDRDGLSPWLTDASDDAGNARPAYVATKNVFFPDQAEIDSVELYIKHYLFQGHRWDEGVGGMQMTGKEPYPYGIYGTFDNWHQHRTVDPNPPPDFRPRNPQLSPEEGWTMLHREHLWRIYDYPHIMLLYYRMYQIGKMYPDMVKYATADEYLMLAYNTSVGYWTVPMQTDKPRGWSANSVPTMNEAFVPELIAALEREGKAAEAARLHELWNGKVARFVNPETRPNLFGSEFAFDSTGFESTASMARYAMTHASKPGRGYTPEQAKEFLEFQLRLNMGDRGWLENTYYQLGSDYRGNLTYLLSYMSQMGGWGVLDYALFFAEDPTDCLRLGYASSLSSWALVNSGTPESGYGFWWPGRDNDGAAGGGFMPEPIGSTWIRKTTPRGAWYYSAEQDVAYSGALRNNAVIVAKDPVFGELAYGGVLTREGDTVSVVPRDGLRARFHVIRGAQRLLTEMIGAVFAKERPVLVDDTLTRLQFTVENPTRTAHTAQLCVNGLAAGEYRITVDGRSRVVTMPGGRADHYVELPLGDAATAEVIIQKTN